ncbi:MAG TPA: two-component regulator propeller domain-containing protein, partial [Silvibacterium sp.]|nr:two-component regulator propeller domain-containing protein [Silvibacterium sp.]
NRYDGYTFKVYKHDAQDDRSLGCDSAVALYVDRAGVLWVGTMEGIDRYDRNTDSFVHYRYRADDWASLPGHEVRSFYEDESGTLWVAVRGGLSRFDRASGRFATYKRNPEDPARFGDTDVWWICPDRTSGLFWIGTADEGVSVLDPSTGFYTLYKNNPNDPASLSNDDARHIFQDRTGSLWISTAHGLNRFDPQTHTFIRYLHDPRNPASLSDDLVTMTYEDRAGRFWVATNNGLNLMDRPRGTFIRYLHDPADSSSLGSNVINLHGMFMDDSGALWIGMRSAGVDRLGEAAKFTTWRHNSQNATSPSSNVITAVTLGSAGELWIGTEAGVDRFDGRTFTHYVANPNDPGSLSPGPRAVALDSHGVLWTGTYGSGLDRLDGKHVKHFRHDPRNSDSPANDKIANIVPENKGGLWIGVHGNGLDYFDGQHFTHFPPNPADPAALPDGYVLPLLLDQEGMLWLGTSNSGLVQFDTHTRKFRTFLLDPSRPGSQAANWTEDVYSDGASLWVASSTGLFRFDLKTSRFTRHYTEKDGLANNSVVGVQGDAQGNLWVSTANGLSRFDPGTGTFRSYDMFDGLQGNDFYPHCHARARDGRLFFGGVNGLNAFYPDKIPDNRTPPPVVLTDFDLFNKPVKIGGKGSPLRQAINVASSITLNHDQSVFRFQFAALNYTAPQKNQYAYRLDPFDREWQYTDATRRFATYTHLDPGDYTFRVKASNNDGVWNEQGVALRVRILPPWWGTWWFRALCAAAILALLWAVHVLRLRQLQEQEKKFREAVETMPAMAFIAQRDGFRTFVNNRWLAYTGLTAEQAAGAGWRPAIHPDDLKRILEKWRASLASGEPLEYEGRLRGADGQYRWFLTRAVPLRDARGKIVKWCGAATDIEDRKRAEELQTELAHISRVTTLGEMAASLAHEIKQPIAATIASASSGRLWLDRDPPNVNKALAALDRIEKDGNRAANIIDRLRALYKKAPPKREPVAVNQVIGEMVVLLRGEANKNAVSLRTDLGAELPMVMADRVQLQQVLMNLMLNGMEAMKETGGVLTVKSQLGQGGPVLISVSDTGPGLPPGKAEHIFDAFFTTKPQGSGMGLSICRSIIESHGGRIWAGGNEGSGAAFHFTLPVATEEAHAAAAEAQSGRSQASSE